MEETLNDLLTRLEHEWAPQLLRTAAGVAFWDGLGWIIVGIVLLILAIVGTVICVKCLRIDLSRDDRYDISNHGVVGLITGLSALLTLIPSLIILLNIWNWVALFNPELAVAKRIFDAVLKANAP